MMMMMMMIIIIIGIRNNSILCYSMNIPYVFNSVQFNSIVCQFSSVQFNSVQFNSIRFQFSSIQVQFTSIQFNAIPFNLFNSIQFTSILFNSIQVKSKALPFFCTSIIGANAVHTLKGCMLLGPLQGPESAWPPPMQQLHIAGGVHAIKHACPQASTWPVQGHRNEHRIYTWPVHAGTKSLLTDAVWLRMSII